MQRLQQDPAGFIDGAQLMFAVNLKEEFERRLRSHAGRKALAGMTPIAPTAGRPDPTTTRPSGPERAAGRTGRA